MVAVCPAAAAGPLIEHWQGEAHPDITGTGGAGNFFGFELALSGGRLVVSAPLEQDVHFRPGALYVFLRDGNEWVREARLLAEGATPLGYSLAMDGDTVVAGAFGSQVEAPGTNYMGAGQAVIYVRNGTNWYEQARLEALRDGARLGVSVAIRGDAAYVGVPDLENEPGEVRQYFRAGTNWTWEATLRSDTPLPGDQYGRSLARTGNRLAVIARGENAVYVYTGGGTNWVKEATLTPVIPMEGVELARIAWMDDNRLVVIALGDSHAVGNPVDRIYLFSRNGTNWLEEAVLTDSASTDADDSFGWGAVMHQGKLIVGGENVTDGAFLQVFEPSGTNWIEGARHPIGSSIVTSLDHDNDELLVGMPRHQARGAVRRLDTSGTNWTAQTDLDLGDGGDGHYFGFSVALDGNWAIVGAPMATPPGVYLFRNTGTQWVREAKFEGSLQWPHGFNLGSAVALSGDTALAGDPFLGQSDDGPSYVQIYTRSGTNWSQQAKLTSTVADTYDMFGWALSAEGDTALVGAPEMDHPTEGHTDWGGVHIYHRAGTNWNLQTLLVPHSGAGQKDFGYAVSLSGDRALIGAPFFAGPGAGWRGQAFVYERFGTNWTQVAELIPDSDGWMLFGKSVSLDGDQALVGAPNVTVDGHANAGCVYLFARDTTNGWLREACLVAPNPHPDAGFGTSVSLCGDRLLVGAPETNEPTSPGQAYLFQRRGTNWIPRQIQVEDASPRAWLGYATALNDQHMAIGSPTESGTAQQGEFSADQGRVCFFDLVEPYGHWVETQGLIPGVTDGLLHDPDGDGSHNLYEYATGSDATNSASVSSLLIETGAVVRFTRNPDALDASLVLERSTNLTEGGAWTGIASNIWGQWIGDMQIEETVGSPRTVNVPLDGTAPPHAAYRLDVQSPTP